MALLDDLQENLFGELNRRGSRIILDPSPDGKDAGGNLGIVDRWRILRAVPHAGSDKAEFWVLWRSLYFTEGPQFNHLLHVARWFKGNNDLTLYDGDNAGRSFTAEFLTKPAELAAWQQYQDYKKANAAQFERYDQTQYERWLPMANGDLTRA